MKFTTCLRCRGQQLETKDPAETVHCISRVCVCVCVFDRDKSRNENQLPMFWLNILNHHDVLQYAIDKTQGQGAACTKVEGDLLEGAFAKASEGSSRLPRVHFSPKNPVA